MSQPSQPDSHYDEHTSWRQMLSNGFAGAVASLITAATLAVCAAVVSSLRGSLPPWFHAMSSNWMLTICVAAVLLVIGFVGGVGYAAAAGLYAIELIVSSVLHKPKPRRRWWHVPTDWLAVIGMWLGLVIIGLGIYAREGMEHIRVRPQTQSASSTDETERLRAEIELLRIENERLRAKEVEAVERRPNE